jgi:YHS domain-containing protein
MKAGGSMKTIVAVAGVAIALMGFGLAGASGGMTDGKTEAAQPVKKQTVCPVMGGAVNTNIYVDAVGKRVYFCCNGCPAEFKKSPAKFIAKMEKSGITLDKAPVIDAKKAEPVAGAALKSAECVPAAGGECCK